MVDRNVALIAVIALLVAATGLAGATAQHPVQQNETDLDTHPDDGHYVVEVIPRGPGEVDVSIVYHYSPRSPTEQRLARNSTLDAEWFRGGEILQGARQYRNRSAQDFEVPWDGVGVSYSENDDRISISRNVDWPGFMRDRDRVVIGPGFASQLENGDEFEVQLATYNWANWSSNFEAGRISGESGSTYTWIIGEDPEPRLVFNRSDYKSHEGDELGLTPFVLPLLALVLLAVAERIRK